MKNAVEWISVRLPLILLIVGIASGIISFFINWESFTEINTTGFDFGFGNRHEAWRHLIGYQCYIPTVIFVCSLASLVALIMGLRKDKYHYEMYIFCLIFGITMIAVMVLISTTKITFPFGTFYFADRIGEGTRFAWLSSVSILNSGILYLASRRSGTDGK